MSPRERRNASNEVQQPRRRNAVELSGHLTAEKWRTSADELVDMLVAMIERHAKE